jgi:homogentisate phytyltransferase/homogentisate geranylgeranyltransferase
LKQITTFIRFSRPHTIIATSLQVIGLFILAGGLEESTEADTFQALVVLLLAFISCLGANIYIVGLNQLQDIEVDRINKPSLPLASGEYSVSQGRWIVAITGLVALFVSATQGRYLFATVAVSMLIGTVYSLPPLYLKGRAYLAALSIAFVRGLVTNIGLYLHFHNSLHPNEATPWLLVIGIAFFFFGFGLVIALYKDLPDLLGDRQFGVRTFSVRLGQNKVFNFGRWLLTGFYLIPILAGILLLPGLNGLILIFSHLFILAVFWRSSQGVDLTDAASVTRFYLLLWGLFYVEYLLLSLYATVTSVGAGNV